MKKEENLEIIKAKMRKIISLLQKWDYEYYVLDNPTIEDSIYDLKFNELKKIENDYNLVLSESPTNKLNSDIFKGSKFKLIKREKPMLSIDSVENIDDLLKFDKKIKKYLDKDKEELIDYVCELKIDGLSASLIYKSNKLNQITTRGDGYLGEDVTFNKELISDIPLSPKFDSHQQEFEVRGEIYIKKSEFLQINKEIMNNGLKVLSNARNAAAGTMRTLIPNKNRKLNFLAYQLFLPGIKSQSECLEILKKSGFMISENRFCRGINEVIKYLDEVEALRDQIEFSIDGVVIKLDSYKDHEILGVTNKFPRWSLAYKFTSQTAFTKIEKIITEVSKNGRISYVAIVAPICIDGSKINKVSLHNFAFIKKKYINIGDEIWIKKAGDIIPQISEMVKKTKDYWIPPKLCSSCSSSLVWNNNDLYQTCQNKDCFEKNINYLSFFISKIAMNINGISKATIEKLYKASLVKKPNELYELKNKAEKIIEIEGFKEKTIRNILNSIEKSRYQEPFRVISSFSIPLLSSVKAKKFSALFEDNYDKILDFVEKADFSIIEKELGKKTKESITLFFSNSNNLENFKNTIKHMISS
jgi:DNA ligase (NAD+)